MAPFGRTTIHLKDPLFFRHRGLLFRLRKAYGATGRRNFMIVATGMHRSSTQVVDQRQTLIA
jgi:hypothetical protein